MSVWGDFMSLTLHLNQLAAMDEIVKIEQTIAWPDAGRKDLLHATPIEVQLEVESSGNAVHVRGTLKTRLTFSCSRCLETFDVEKVIEVDEGFTQDESLVEADEDEWYQLVEGEILDLKPHLEEIALLSLPMAPLCRDDCLGLCPSCGVNRNETTCQCNEEKIDPRLEGLKDFFKER